MSGKAWLERLLKLGCRVKDRLFRMKDRFILGGWILGILLIGGLLWGLTQSSRLIALRNSINRALIDREEPRRLHLPVSGEGTGPGIRGHWFSMFGEESRALVFSIMAEGTLLPCAAIVSPEGRVEKIIPLTISSEKGLARLSPGIVQTYIRRLEGSLSGEGRDL
jgi:hypothetical protein